MPLQLLQVAQSSADALAVYRKPTSMHAVALLLLHQAAGRGSITSEDADAYLSNAVAHVHTLAKRSRRPTSTHKMRGRSSGSRLCLMRAPQSSAVRRLICEPEHVPKLV